MNHARLLIEGRDKNGKAIQIRGEAAEILHQGASQAEQQHASRTFEERTRRRTIELLGEQGINVRRIVRED